MDRRSFLVGTAALALSQGLSSCGNQTADSLKIRLLKGSIPAQMLSQFRQSLKGANRPNPTLEFTPEKQLKDLFALLQTWQAKDQPGPTSRFKLPALPWGKRSQPNPAHLVTLGDSWLAAAIQQNLIQPLDASQWQQWSRIPERWQALVKRDRTGNLDPQGQIWGAPYRWGSTVIAYRTDKFKDLGWVPTDWSDLWRPELRDRISLLDQPREVIGLTLKKLGYSYNTPDLKTIPNLETELHQLHNQAKLYSSDSYLQPLMLEDTWVAVGWSTDLLPILAQSQAAAWGKTPEIQAIIPRSGTALWADLWVHPTPVNATSTPSLLAAQWIDFCWQPAIASQLSLLSQATSPAVLGLSPEQLPATLRHHPLLFPSAEILAQSEFLTPLAPETSAQYETLWKEMRLS